MDIKNILVTALIAIVVVIGANVLVGDNQGVGAGSRFPNGISADSTSPSAGEVRGTTLQVDNGSATTSVIIDKVCYTFTDTRGVALYGYYTSGGTFATSSTDCNS